uniref:Uncharacterized protein n=1 Tax=Avena sativa TaxID=4498 RepID=A0ACD5WEL5_AVESA
MDPKHGDLDQQSDHDAWIALPLLPEQNHNSVVVVSMEPKHGDLDSTGTPADFDEWINLPLDLCHLILDRLGAFEILRFPLVCRPWADVYAEKRLFQPTVLQPGIPTLLTSASDCGWEIQDDYLRGLFFITNILSREVFPIEVEGMKCRSWIGGKHDWLVTATRGSCVQLLNPSTGHCIALPDYSIRPSDRVQLCRTPAETDGYFLIAISSYKLCYTMKGCDHWIRLENPNQYWLNYSDALIHRGKIIAICQNGNLWSWDLDQGGRNPILLLSSSINTEAWELFDFTLAPSLNDNILIIIPYGEDIPIRLRRREPSHSNYWNFYVHGVLLYEVDIDSQSIEEVRDIGDRALFLGPNYPLYIPVSVPMGDLKKNYLYIAAMSEHDVVAIDLTLEDVPGNVSLIDYSGPHDLGQVPMWFRPAFPSNVG